jgi:hypothetical protein
MASAAPARPQASAIGKKAFFNESGRKRETTWRKKNWGEFGVNIFPPLRERAGDAA